MSEEPYSERYNEFLALYNELGKCEHREAHFRQLVHRFGFGELAAKDQSADDDFSIERKHYGILRRRMEKRASLASQETSRAWNKMHDFIESL